MPTRDGFSPRPGAGAPPRRSERDAALDRIQGIRVAIGSKSLWLKRGSVGGVALAIGTGALQGWPALSLLSMPLAALFWWLDASLARTDRSLQHLYESVFDGGTPPPLIGEESAAAKILPEPPNPARWALLSSPGAGLHLMMVGVSVLFNLLI